MVINPRVFDLESPFTVYVLFIYKCLTIISNLLRRNGYVNKEPNEIMSVILPLFKCRCVTVDFIEQAMCANRSVFGLNLCR